MYTYFSLRQLESDILDTKAQLYKSVIPGIEINSIRVTTTEEVFETIQKDIKQRIIDMTPPDAIVNPELATATINHINFADIQVFFERVSSEDEIPQYVHNAF